MAKRLFLLLLICSIGIAVSPSLLSADNYFPIKGPDFNAVETIIPEPEPEVEPEPVKEVVVEQKPAVEQKAVATPASYATVEVAPAPVVPKTVNYTVSFYVNSLDEYSRTASNLSYSGIYKFRKMIYGHNTANLLGNLAGRQVGETITITEGGATKNYRVAAIQVYQKTADGYLEGDKRLMNNIANTAMGHSLALLTCHGTNYGNGDASHRLVVFVDEI